MDDIRAEILRRTDGYYLVFGENEHGQTVMICNCDEDMEIINAIIGEVLLENSIISQEDYEAVDSDDYFIYYVADEYYYSDECFICDECSHIFPNYLPNLKINYYIDDKTAKIHCSNCAVQEAEEYIDYLLESPCERLNLFLSEDILKKHGFVALSDTEYETGLYGKTDSPHPIYYKLSKSFKDIIFSATSVTAFATEWKVFVRGEKN